MIYHTIHDLRSSSWTRQVARECIQEHIDDDGNRVTRQVIRWNRPDCEGGVHPWRSYIVLMSDGGLYIIFFQHRHRTDDDERRQRCINENRRYF